jgi:non-homologous end joining protein Ku
VISNHRFGVQITDHWHSAAPCQEYYLAPNGPACQAMVAEDRYGDAQVVLHGREQLVLLRPQANLLILEVLHYRHQVTQPAALADEVPRMEVSPEELHMARTLVHASTADFHLEKYADLYTHKLEQLIEAKVAGQAYPLRLAERWLIHKISSRLHRIFVDTDMSGCSTFFPTGEKSQ